MPETPPDARPRAAPPPGASSRDGDDAEARHPGSATRRALRRLAPPLVVVALVGIEIARGARRIDDQEAGHAAELRASIERQQGRLAGEAAALLGEPEGHALYLSRAPVVHDLVRAAADGAELEPTTAALERALLPHLASFRGIDRVSVLGANGRELARCERMGAGVAAIPAALLDPAPHGDLLALASDLSFGAVATSALVDDAERVEVAAGDRLVLHYVARVEVPPGVAPEAGDAPARGYVAVTAYAAPLLRALKDFAPIPGTWSALIDVAGPAPRLFAAPEPDADAWADEDALVAAVMRSDGVPAGEAPGERAALFATPLERARGGGPPMRLVSAVPVDALRAASGLTTGERLRAASSSLVMLLAIALATALFVRQELRAARLREAQGYLRRLRDEVRRYRALMEAAVDVLLVLSPPETSADPSARGDDLGRGRVRDWNGAAGAVFGLGEPPGGLDDRDLDARPTRDRGGVPIARVLDAFDVSGRDALRAAVAAALARPGVAVERAGLSMSATSARGAQVGPRELDVRCIALSYGGEALVEVALLDRTREREMERRVQTTDRLGSLGLFTAGVAHEINNPLEGIGNYLALLERGSATGRDGEERRAHHLRQVRAGIDRIRAIVGDLLRFARTAPDEASTDLAAAVDGALSMARFTEHLGGVTVERRGLDAPLFVRGSGRRLEQVILNLILNAGRAMDGNGTLVLAARRAEPGFVELHVEDDGPGIAPGDLPRLFDPFFTRSGGTGLGLSVSYGIVRTIGGDLSAENQSERGARFVVRLPEPGADPATPNATRSDAETRKTEP